MFLERPGGKVILNKVLEKMALWFEAEEESVEGRSFDIGYKLFGQLFEEGGQQKAFRLLGS